MQEYKSQYHVFHPFSLLYNGTLSVPSQGPIAVVGGGGGTATTFAQNNLTVSRGSVTLPSETINIAGGAGGAQIITAAVTLKLNGTYVTVPAQVCAVTVGGGTVTIPAQGPIQMNAGFAYETTRHVSAFTVFPVKEIRFSWAYNISSEVGLNMLVTADITNNDIVGNFAQFQYEDGAGNYWYADGIKKANTFSYIFREARQVQGSILFTFNDTTASVLNLGNITCHMEFLG